MASDEFFTGSFNPSAALTREGYCALWAAMDAQAALKPVPVEDPNAGLMGDVELLSEIVSEEWRSEAACQGSGHIFFPIIGIDEDRNEYWLNEQGQDVPVVVPEGVEVRTSFRGGSELQDSLEMWAEQICFGCSVREECLNHSLTYQEAGTWGGVNELDRLSALGRNRRSTRFYGASIKKSG